MIGDQLLYPVHHTAGQILALAERSVANGLFFYSRNNSYCRFTVLSKICPSVLIHGQVTIYRYSKCVTVLFIYNSDVIFRFAYIYSAQEVTLINEYQTLEKKY